MKTLFTLLFDWKPSVLVVDESHRCKSIKSKRAKAVEILSGVTTYRYILTGTPVLNSAMDLFQQFKILDLGKTFGQNFYSYRGRYFEDSNARWAGKPNYFSKWEARPEAYAELSKKISSMAVYAKKSECLDLPPLVRESYEVELGNEQFRLYKEMLNDYVTFILDERTKQSKAVMAQLAITKALRLRQILSGFVKTDTGEEVPLEDVPRADALKELLEDLCESHKVVVWAVFKQDYERIRGICKSLELEYAELHGDIKDKDIELEKWKKPSCRVMIANQGAGGIGIDLIESDVSIYYSKSFSLEHDIQSEARNYRGGSEIHKKITRIDLVTAGTLDEVVSEALIMKQDIGTKILEWVEKEKEKHGSK
jgi:SNF2 family DNA or RNA helicase